MVRGSGRTLVEHAGVVVLALNDGLQVLDTGGQLVGLVLVELHGRFDVFLDVEAGAHIDDDVGGVGECAVDVERVGQGD